MWVFLSDVTASQMIIITVCVLVLITAITAAVLLSFKTLRIKKVSFKGAEMVTETTLDASIIQHLEVRDFRNVLRRGIYAILSNVRARVRKNGWASIKDWPEYKSLAIVSADRILTRIMDEHYYSAAKLERTELFEWNKIIDPEIKAIYSNMYNRMYEIVKTGYSIISEKRKELEAIQKKRICEPEATVCPSLYKIIKLTTEILIDENLSIREGCMIEAERSLDEVEQIYYSHYLARYKQMIGEKE